MRRFGQTETVTPVDKLISIATYLTMGLAGFIYLIIITLQKATMKPFLKYHIMQSIFVSILLYVITLIAQIIVGVARHVPFVNDIIATMLGILMGPLVFGFSVLNALVVCLIIYLCIGAIRSKYSYIPWVSDNIKQML